MKRKLMLIALVLGLSFGLGCEQKEKEKASGTSPGKVLAEVNGKKITEADFNAELEGKPDFYKQYAQSEAGKKQILENLIEKELLLQTAEKEGITNSPEVEAKVRDYRARVIMEQLREKISSTQGEITEEDLKNYYDTHPEQFNPPDQVRLKQIVLNDVKEAGRVAQEAKAAPDQFSELAKKYSQDEATKARGGDLGFVKKGSLPSEIEARVFSMKEGEVSPVISSQGKFYIFQVLQKKASEHKEFDQVKDSIKRRMEYERKQSAWREYLDGLKKDAQIKYYLEESSPTK